jgi:sugar (pentulose or hexulose) kinase
MITLECNYSKKLGLPGYSSHQFAITLKTEIPDLNQVQSESARLYKLLQEGVDTSIKETGYLPTHGNGNGQRGGQSGNGNGGNGHNQNQPAENGDWNCSGKQRDLIIRTQLLVLPYWTASGTPYFDLRTPGAILGLRLSTTRGEILRALREGVAMEMRLNLEVLRESGCEIRELRAVGGGAKSAFWTQLKADVLCHPITTLNVAEAGCLGVAMLACAATTGQALPELARGWVKPQATVLPRAAGYYEERFARYRELYPALRRIPL